MPRSNFQVPVITRAAAFNTRCNCPAAKKTNEWILNKGGVKREVLDTVKARKLAYYGHTMKKQGSCLE